MITAKNEERILRHNLLYHKAIGISRIFVYFDGSTDCGQESIEDLGNVTCSDSVEPEKYMHLKFLDKFTSQARSMHTARQCLNIYDALQQCKAEQIDWLIALDADELFLTDKKRPTSIDNFFEKHNNVDIIKLKPLEVVSRRKEYKNVFLQETLFQSQPRFKNWNDRIYFKFYDPYTGESLSHPAWLSHTIGKCAVNVNSDLIPQNVHKFQFVDKRRISQVYSGCILHYSLYDFMDFKKKFFNIKHRPSIFLNGNSLPRLPLVWRDLVNDPKYDENYLENYFISNLLVNDQKLERFFSTRFFNILRRKESAIVHIDYVKKVLKSIDNDDE